MGAARFAYRAPWGRELIALSAVGLLALVVPTTLILRRGGFIVGTLLAILTLVVMSTTVRGYEISRDSIAIRRLFWTTRWPLARPTKASVKPQAMSRSWRLWGNGGLFAFSGHFSNAELGAYRAFVTDFDRTVLLETPKGLLVVSPDDPEQFTSAIAEVTQPTSGSTP